MKGAGGLAAVLALGQLSPKAVEAGPGKEKSENIREVEPDAFVEDLDPRRYPKLNERWVTVDSIGQNSDDGWEVVGSGTNSESKTRLQELLGNNLGARIMAYTLGFRSVLPPPDSEDVSQESTQSQVIGLKEEVLADVIATELDSSEVRAEQRVEPKGKRELSDLEKDFIEHALDKVPKVLQRALRDRTSSLWRPEKAILRMALEKTLFSNEDIYLGETEGEDLEDSAQGRILRVYNGENATLQEDGSILSDLTVLEDSFGGPDVLFNGILRTSRGSESEVVYRMETERTGIYKTQLIKEENGKSRYLVRVNNFGSEEEGRFPARDSAWILSLEQDAEGGKQETWERVDANENSPGQSVPTKAVYIQGENDNPSVIVLEAENKVQLLPLDREGNLTGERFKIGDTDSDRVYAGDIAGNYTESGRLAIGRTECRQSGIDYFARETAVELGIFEFKDGDLIIRRQLNGGRVAKVNISESEPYGMRIGEDSGKVTLCMDIDLFNRRGSREVLIRTDGESVEPNVVALSEELGYLQGVVENDSFLAIETVGADEPDSSGDAIPVAMRSPYQ